MFSVVCACMSVQEGSPYDQYGFVQTCSLGTHPPPGIWDHPNAALALLDMFIQESGSLAFNWKTFLLHLHLHQTERNYDMNEHFNKTRTQSLSDT